MPNDPNEQGREDRRQKMIPSAAFARSPRVGSSRELAGDEFEIALDQGEIGSRLIGLAQRQGVFVWHDTRYGRMRLPEVKPLTARPIRRSCRAGASNAIDHRREPPPRQAELLCPDLVPGVRRIEHPRGEEARAPL